MRLMSQVTMCVLLSSLVCQADGPVPGFLKPKEDFQIQFAGRSPFQKTVRVPVSRNEDEVNSFRRPRTITHTVEIFSVVALAGGPWVLVEHPQSLEDAEQWNKQRIALASLTPQFIAALESTPDGKERLKELRANAKAEIETSRTWININHAITINRPPIEQPPK